VGVHLRAGHPGDPTDSSRGLGPAKAEAKYDLTVKIVEHGATFSAPNWVGKTQLTATLARFQDAPDSEWTATGQVVKWNWLDWDTARSAFEEAYQTAITDLLRQLAASPPPPAR
jgi:hypothetical protein